MSKHVKLLLENVQKPSCTPLGNLAEAEIRRGNFDLSYGCRRSGRNPLHLWRGGSQEYADSSQTNAHAKRGQPQIRFLSAYFLILTVS